MNSYGKGFNYPGSLDVGHKILQSLNEDGIQICTPHPNISFIILFYWLTQWYINTPVFIPVQVNMLKV